MSALLKASWSKVVTRVGHAPRLLTGNNVDSVGMLGGHVVWSVMVGRLVGGRVAGTCDVGGWEWTQWSRLWSGSVLLALAAM
jgi:hypothetical protein